jgi:hypothetical protein
MTELKGLIGLARIECEKYLITSVSEEGRVFDFLSKFKRGYFIFVFYCIYLKTLLWVVLHNNPLSPCPLHL